MDKSKNFENQLPSGYVLKKHVDAKTDKKIIIIYSLLSFVPLLIITPAVYFCADHFSGYNAFREIQFQDTFAIYIMCLALLIYIVLHELVHGITYKIFTGGKLKFGLTLTTAFCGVPDLYVRRKASIAALVMPFSVFTVIFGALTVGLYIYYPLYGLIASVLFSVHLGGCVGDLHWTLLYLTKFKNCETLMRDIGPEQWLYVYDPDEYSKQQAN